MKLNNVPIVPGTVESINSINEAKKFADEIGYPIMLKATAGGGGKGMRKIDSVEEFESAFERAQNESLKAFGSTDVYMEKYIEDPKHIEVQIIADKHGNYRHLFERECSVQRRHQKIIEEAPSASVNEKIREKLTAAAVNAAKACRYFNAGTIEFLMDKNKNVYFLEMNTRLQVEHPVTEMITGFDLVKEQISIAAGNKISFNQNKVKIKGHAIECRVYAEDVENNFAPSIGKILHHRLPSGPGIRVDRGIDLLSEVSVYYDPLLSKIVAWGDNRNTAIERMKRALCEYQIVGVITNLQACRWVLEHRAFQDSTFDINFLEKEFVPLVPDEWKDNLSENYENAAAILGVLLRAKENELKPVNLDISLNNNWNQNNHE
jgi:acetyl/propionyl-CoA carboxylase alpha subunit